MSFKKWDNVTNEQLLDLLRLKAQEINKTPSSDDMKGNRNYPTTSYFTKRFKPLTWNMILELAGLKVNHENNMDLEEGLKKLKEYYEFLGRIPTREDFKINSWKPCHTWYGRKFGRFENALKEAKIINYENKLEEAIKNLKNLSSIQNKIPDYNSYKKYNQSLHLKVDILKITGLTYNELCQKYISQYELNREYQYPTKEELKADMLELYEKLGRIPTSRDLYNRENKYPLSCYRRVFNYLSYPEILEEIGIKYDIESSIRKSDEKLLSDFKDLFYKLKRIPSYKELDSDNICASSTTYEKRFGSIENICKLLNIEYVPQIINSGVGTVCLDKNNGICKSTSEMQITNYFIDNGIKYEKEIMYKKIIDNFNKSYRFDWKIEIDNKIYYIEYFGLYSNTSTSKIIKDYRKRVKQKIKILYKAGIINQCIFIFPKDIKCNKGEWLQQKLESFLLNKYNLDINLDTYNNAC